MGEVQTAMPFGVVHDPSTDSDSYCTPTIVWGWVDEFWPDGFDIDPMTNALAFRRGKVANWTISDDAFSQPTWSVRGQKTKGWLNPPYSDPQPGVRRLCEEWWTGAGEWLALLKSDHSTSWWDDVVSTCTALCLLRKRVTFYLGGKPVKGNNFASAIFYWGPRAGLFRGVFHRPDRGWVYPGERKRPHWIKETT